MEQPHRRWSEDGFHKAKKFTVQQLTEELGYNLDQCGYPHEEEEILAPLDLIHRYEEQRASLNAEIDRVLAEITAKLGGKPMTPQELKNSILQLAIQGKLVEQRPEEGTAEELFARIQAEKQRLIKEGKIKKEKPLPEITEDEKPFEIPESWMWVRRNGPIVDLGGRSTPSRTNLKFRWYKTVDGNVR